MLATARAAAFAGLFYVVTAAFLIVGSPLLFGPRRAAMAGLRTHARACLWLQKWVAGTTYEVRGLEHLPPGPCLVVAKHQSAWETFALIPLLSDPAIVMKSELASIPLYGWFCRKFDHILVHRDRRAAALKDMVTDAQQRAGQGRQILIFAEGTRTQPGAAADYKPGFMALYSGLDVPAVPLALNSGLYWPARSTLSYPGRIIVAFGPPRPAGENRKTAGPALIDWIETTSHALIAEAAAEKPRDPRIEAALARQQTTK